MPSWKKQFIHIINWTLSQWEFTGNVFLWCVWDYVESSLITVYPPNGVKLAHSLTVSREGMQFPSFLCVCVHELNKHRKRPSLTSQSSCSPPSYKAGCWLRLAVISWSRWASTGSWSGSAAHHGRLPCVPLLDIVVFHRTPSQLRSSPHRRTQNQTFALF